MKIRQGFVSNSSSSSFIIRFKGEATLEQCEDMIRYTWGDDLKDTIIEKKAQQLLDLLQPYNGKKKESWSWTPITPAQVKKYEKDGYKLYEVWLSDHHCDTNCVCINEGLVSEQVLENDWQWSHPEQVIEQESQH